MADPTTTAQSATTTKKDEIDPELVALRRPRRGVGPLLGLSVLTLAAYLMITQRTDLRYALSSKEPAEIADLASLPAGGYVTLRAKLDHTATVRVRGKQDTGARLVAARGTGGKVWIQVEGEPFNAKPVYDPGFTGRLRPLADLEYAGRLRAYLAEKLPAQPRYLFPEMIAKGIPDRDVLGDPLRAAPTTPVGVDQTVRDRAFVTLVATDTVKTDADAARLLVDAGLMPAGAAPVESTPQAWTWEIAAPGGVDALRAMVAEKGLAGKTLLQPKTQRHEGSFSQLSVAGDAVRLADVTIPLADVERVVVFTRPEIAGDAMVLVEGEAPGKFWYLPYLYGALALVSLVMIWATIRGLLVPKPAPVEAGE
jgi:hypothetical protein